MLSRVSTILHRWYSLHQLFYWSCDKIHYIIFHVIKNLTFNKLVTNVIHHFRGVTEVQELLNSNSQSCLKTSFGPYQKSYKKTFFFNFCKLSSNVGGCTIYYHKKRVEFIRKQFNIGAHTFLNFHGKVKSKQETLRIVSHLRWPKSFEPPQLDFENFNIFGGLYITQSNIYGGAFMPIIVSL